MQSSFKPHGNFPPAWAFFFFNFFLVWLLSYHSLVWLVGCCLTGDHPYCHKLDGWVPSCGFPPPPSLFNKSFWSLDWNFQGIFWSVGPILWRGQSCTLLGSLKREDSRWVTWVNWPLPNNQTLNALTLPI